ncbi:class I SAM-dependent methyltransferase [Nocardioides sp.]|uniref:class I SAM-dependent methyltransferase n=1 Tax=Nocardioides sp. TaxID=35761 RepID=UPI003D0D8136
MGVWTDRVVPRLTDRALRGAQFDDLRRSVCAGLEGHVLELGFGSGLNLEHYPTGVTRVSAVEPADVGWNLSATRRGGFGSPVRRVGLDGQQLDAADGSFDSVLVTFTLCTIPDPARALAEVARVLVPGGTLHLLEHGRAPDEGVVRWQCRLDPWQQRVFAGCHLSRDVPALVSAAGLEITELDQRYLPGPSIARPWAYAYRGRAAKMVS